MPTIKPRVAVTLEPSTHEVIARMAQLQDRTRGAVIAELLDAVAPSLARTVALLEAAQEAPEQVKKGLLGVLDDMHDELLGVTGRANTQVDSIVSAMRRDVVNPHVVTRGSGTGVGVKNQAQKGSEKRKRG